MHIELTLLRYGSCGPLSRACIYALRTDLWPNHAIDHNE